MTKTAVLTAAAPIAKIDLVAPHSIPQHWGQIEPLIERALAPVDSGFSVIDVTHYLFTNQMHVWCVNDWQGLVITQVQHAPQHNTLAVIFIAGEDFQLWCNDLIARMRMFAGACDCKYTEVFGRPGWDKWLTKDASITKKYTVLRMHSDG